MTIPSSGFYPQPSPVPPDPPRVALMCPISNPSGLSFVAENTYPGRPQIAAFWLTEASTGDNFEATYPVGGSYSGQPTHLGCGIGAIPALALSGHESGYSHAAAPPPVASRSEITPSPTSPTPPATATSPSDATAPSEPVSLAPGPSVPNLPRVDVSVGLTDLSPQNPGVLNGGTLIVKACHTTLDNESRPASQRSTTTHQHLLGLTTSSPTRGPRCIHKCTPHCERAPAGIAVPPLGRIVAKPRASVYASASARCVAIGQAPAEVLDSTV